MNSSINELLPVYDEKSLSLLIDMLDKIPGGFFIYRADGNEEILYTNEAVLRIFGCDTLDEFKKLTGYTFKGMVHPDEIDDIEKSISEQISGSVYDLDYVEYRIIQKDGSTRWISDYGHFVSSDLLGDVFYVFIEDATDRLKKRMEKLKEVNNELLAAYAKESQYRKAILYDAVLFFEVNISNDEFITNVTHMLGTQIFNLDEILDESKFSECVRVWSKHITQTEPDEYRRFFDRARLEQCHINGELEQTYDCWITDTLGRSRLSHYVVLLGKNEHTGDIVALVMVKDMTEQLESQQLLKMSLRQAQTANIAKSTFLANMSHDIRTPLNAILGYAELMKLHKTDTDRIEEYAEKIKVSGKELLNILNEALEVTRMESGKAALAETEWHLVDLLAEVEKTVIGEMNTKSIQFNIEKSGIKHYVVFADIVRIKDILCQLLDNAAKYTQNGGKVTLTVREEGESGGYGKYFFIVEDNGIGISDEFKEILFEPFTREKNTTKSGILGSGLGLTVVKNLISLMDGEITVESEKGQGSRFTVSLMLKYVEKDRYSRMLNTARKKSGVNKRLLLVEDNEINSEIASALLKESGYIVDTAFDGDEGVEIIKNSEPGYYDFILMDIQMPRMNGYEATKAIRAINDTEISGIPIIALSANTYAEDKKKAIDSGMNAHCSKPVDMLELQRIIETVLEEG